MERDEPRSGPVLEVAGGRYRVHVEPEGEVDASLRGRLKREARTGDRVVPGDLVDVERRSDGAWTVEGVADRRSELVRAGPGGRRPKVVAANLDQVVAVLAARDPAFDRTVADRFLVLAECCGLDPVLVVNKADLVRDRAASRRERESSRVGTDEELAEGLRSYRSIGYPVLVTSAETGEGLDTLRAALRGRVSAVVGPSGVGKSSLLNALDPGLQLRTGPVGRTRRGRHTTVSARLLLLDDDIRVVDTPGFSGPSAWHVSDRDLRFGFPEFRAPAEQCRFRGCSHTHEPGCAVREAVDEGRIDVARYESYCSLLSTS